MLWLAGVHFDSCFDTGKWTADENGLYNRSDKDQSDLTELSQLHNMIFEAVARHRRGQESLGGPLTRNAFRRLEQIVKINHHRQVPDILGIIRLIQRNGLWGATSWLQERRKLTVRTTSRLGCGVAAAN